MDTQVTITDARSYSDLSSAKVLKNAEKRKKDKYLAPCLARQMGYMPLVYSVDGMAGKEAKSFERRITSLLAVKWDFPYREMARPMRLRTYPTISLYGRSHFPARSDAMRLSKDFASLPAIPSTE